MTRADKGQAGALQSISSAYQSLDWASNGGLEMTYSEAHGNPNTFLSAFSWVPFFRFLITIREKKTREKEGTNAIGPI